MCQRLRPFIAPLAFLLPSVCLTFAGTSHAQTVELRDGVRTTFYGGGHGNGTNAGDYLGWAFAFGDVDGDGHTDFLFSSENSEGPNDSHLEPERDVYLFFGRPKGDIDSLYAIDTPGVADIIFYKGGYALACSDIDKDGYDDLILSDAQATGEPAYSGVYVVFGAPRDQLRRTYDFKVGCPDYTRPNIRILGSWTLGGGITDVQNFDADFVSRSLVAGDVNGDGYSDIVIGDYSQCPTPGTCLDGAVYIILGKPRAQLPLTIDVRPEVSLPHPDVVITGDTSERYPVNLALGDLDGDGIKDILASTTRGWGELNMVPQVGEVHGWFGRQTWLPKYHSELDEFDFAIQGRSGDPVGFRMATGDFDGDGRDDLLVGSTGKPRSEYRLYFGRPRELWPKWADAVDLMDVFIRGASGDVIDAIPYEWGIAMSLATGNRDGDHYDDILIGAGALLRPDEFGGAHTGGAYFIRGRPRNQWEPFIDLASDYSMIFYGQEGGAGHYSVDRAGFVTGMADLDGNGRDELLIAAPFADGPANSIPECGEIYVVYDDEHMPTATPSTPSIARAALLPNYPNPFTSNTSFPIQAPTGDEVSLVIYDAQGREVARPLNRAISHGALRVNWSGRDALGWSLPSGVYFAKLTAGHEVHSRKVVLVH